MNAALYARVSSEQQADAGTVASQVEALKQRVVDDGLLVDEALCFIDEGYSGATLVRPALERLRDLVATGAIDRLYVHCPDRLARKYAYQVLLVDEFHRSGVDVVFLNQELGQTPEQELLLQVQGMIAEYERAKILERSRRGKRHAAHQGSVNVLSGAPYGYRYVRVDEGGGQAEYQIVWEEARVVRQVFEWVGQERLSIGEVGRRLQEQGIPTRTGKTYWDRTTVWGMLKNPAYKGTAAFGKTQAGPWTPPLRPQRGHPEQPKRAARTADVPADQWIYIPVPALISEALFDQVQEQLTENRQRQRQRKRGARYLLQGLLVCKHCGYAFYGKPVSRKAAKGKTRTYAYYRCIGTDAYRFGGQRICENKQVRTDLLEQAVWEDLCDLLAHPQRLEQEYQRRLTDTKKGIGQEQIEQLQARMQKMKRGIARLVDAYAETLIDRDEFEPRIQQARQRLEKLQAQTQAQAEEEAQYNELKLVIGGLQDFAARVHEGLQEADWDTRRQMIRTLVKQVEVEKEQVRVVYRVTPPGSEETPDRESLQHCPKRGQPVVDQCIPT
jgi:site-specific DNA recombinase